MRKLQRMNWQDPVIGVLGLWLGLSPWAFGLHGMPMTASVVLGLALVLAALCALCPRRAWEEWLAVGIGFVTVAAPWMHGFSGDRRTMVNAVAVGLLASAAALWALGRKGRFGAGSHDRAVH